VAIFEGLGTKDRDGNRGVLQVLATLLGCNNDFLENGFRFGTGSSSRLCGKGLADRPRVSEITLVVARNFRIRTFTPKLELEGLTRLFVIHFY
jgi:hypothetical protein